MTDILAVPETGLILSDNTTADASTTKHGLAKKAVAPAAGYLNVLGIANGETAFDNKTIPLAPPTKDFVFQPTAMQPLEATSPAWETVDFGTVVATVATFDDTSEEYLNGKFQVPKSINADGTVYLEVVVSPKTGAADKTVGWTFGHAPRATAEAVDASYTDEDSGAAAITATTAYQTVISWSETVANLGWVADDVVYFRLSRYDTGAADLVGDCYMLLFRIRVPVTA